MSATRHETAAATYELQITIEAAPDVVWRALTEEVQAWWLPDFHMAGPDSVVSLDAVPGGQLVERRPDGGGLLWYTVVQCTPGSSLHLVGHVAPAWGGPTTTMLAVELEEVDGATRLRVQDALVGRVTDGQVASLEEGWTTLFSEGLKAHAEAAA